MIIAKVTQLTKKANTEDLDRAELTPNYIQHNLALFPTDPSGIPYTAIYIETTGDFISDSESNMVTKQKARTGYKHLMNLTNDPDLLAPLLFLRQREVVHYVGFKELKETYIKEYKNNLCDCLISNGVSHAIRTPDSLIKSQLKIVEIIGKNDPFVVYL